MKNLFENYSCPNVQKCPFYGFIKHEKLRKLLQFVFCKANFKKCTRYQRRISGKEIPKDLWPLETLSTSEVLKSLDFDISKEILTYQQIFKDYRSSREFKKALTEVFKSLKINLSKYYVALIDFFKNYYDEIFIKNNSQQFFIEIAYQYMEKRINDSLFDSSFLLFIAKLEEYFLNWLKSLNQDNYVQPLMAFQKINTLSLLFIKKNIKLIEELQILYESRKTLLEIKDELYIDPLTKVFNRKFLNTFLDNILDGYDYLLIIDIDYFKKINDTYGHPAGDMALKELCKVVKDELRKNDIVIRYGGEEFLIFLNTKNKNLKVAKKIAERLREEVEKHSFKYNGKNIKFTISIGLTKIEKNKTFDLLFKEADEALYKAKKSGRNRVISYKEIEKSL